MPSDVSKAEVSRTDVIQSWLERAITPLIIGTWVVLIAVVLLQVVARYALPQSPVWTEELSRYLFIYLIVLPSGLVIGRNRNIRLALFQHRFSARWAAAYDLSCHALVGIFAAFCLPYSWQYAMIGQLQTSPALGVSMVYVFVSTVLFFGLVTLYSLFGFLRAVAVIIRSENARWN